MPREDVLRYFREADPKFKDVPDVKLAKFIGDTYPEFQKEIGFSKPKSEFQREAARRKADIGVKQTASDYEQDISNARGQAAGMVAAGIPMAAAAPFTAGASLAPALATGAGMGLLGGIASMEAKGVAGSSDLPSTVKQAAKQLGWDAATGAAGEGVGRLAAAGLTKVTPAILKRTTAAAGDGKATLDNLFVTMRDRFYRTIGPHNPPPINIEADLLAAHRGLVGIPKGAGKFGVRFSGLTKDALEVMDKISEDLTMSVTGTPLRGQPLDALMRVKSSLNQLAYKSGGLNTEEARVFQTLAKKLDGRIRDGIKSLPADAKAVAMDAYEAQNNVAKVIHENNMAVKLVEGVAGSMGKKLLAGAGLGGSAGAYYGQSKESAAAGAAAGAAASVVGPQFAMWAVKKIAEHPEAAYQLKKAVEAATLGKNLSAETAARRAFIMAGVREHMKEVYKPEFIKAAQGQP